MYFRLMTALVLGVTALATTGSQAANPVVVIDTNKGTIKVELFEELRPITVKNFLAYVEAKHYDGLTFHRVISDFMIQGGGYDVAQKERKTLDPIKNESDEKVSNKRGTIAMARTNDLNSATSQFFINVVDNVRLDRPKYCAFGRVIDGMDIVDKIKGVPTGAKGMFEQDCPTDDVIIKSVRRADK